ncbi:MAG: S-layer homology domain-containing protein [Bacillota bacterium]
MDKRWRTFFLVVVILTLSIVLFVGNALALPASKLQAKDFASLLATAGFKVTATNTNAVLTRENAANLVAKALEGSDVDKASASTSALNRFTDAGKIAAANKSGVALAVREGILTGYAKEFKPQDALTKRQADIVIARLKAWRASIKVPTFSVKDTSGTAVVGATVFAIPAADVEALSAVAISRDAKVFGNYSAEAQTVDEPLEDLINGNFTPAGGGVSTYKHGVTDAKGKATITGLAKSNKYFIYVRPADDAAHLPGGSLNRVAVTGASVDKKVTNIVVSTQPSAKATFVGSSTCLACHSDKSDVKKTAHKNGFMVPGSPSGLQDPSKFDTDDGDFNMFAALKDKFTTTGTIVYFYDYDGTRKFDKFKTSETNPDPGGKLGNVLVTLKLFKGSDGKYKMTFTNVKNPSDSRSPLTKEVSLTYGGGVYKQRYMTTAGKSLHVLPLQYNSKGDEASTERTRKVWRDYHMDWWLNDPAGTMTFKSQPAFNNSVDIQCAPCHFNGFSITKDAATGELTATGVADVNGEVNPVTGEKQELNIGCETCHGPGSEHVAAGGQGKSIVSLQNITAEREVVVCAQCHSRPQGKDSLGVKKDAPLNSENKMMIAGTSRAEFLANFTSRHDADSSDMQADGLFSKSHHQQYTDFIQSSKYRNGSKLLTCASCHDLHTPGTDRNQLSGVSDNSLCTSCHTGVKSSEHQKVKTGFDMGAKCIDCHFVKTATSGAGLNQIGSNLHGDISSHLFAVPDKTKKPMPVPYTNPCGTCHTK